ncbi:MAG: hypothetical protein V1857_02470 [archaeon]
MENRGIIGTVLVAIGILGFAIFIPLYAAQQPGYGGWTSMSGIMGSGMMGGMRGSYANQAGQRITIDQATRVAQDYLGSLANRDIAIDEIMEFQYNFYVIYYEKSTEIRAFEMLIDPYTSRVFAEYGPNMMWNTKYGMMSGMGGMGSMMGGPRGPPTVNMPVTKDQAVSLAENYLKSYLPDTSTEDPDVFYGYYTIHILKNGQIYGMLSVNGYNGQVWYHSWHGQFIQMKEF